MSEITANYDEPWKEAIGEYFPEFLTFFFSDIYDLIDWRKKPISLEKELQKITADSNDSKRFVDKLFQVWLKDNQEIWILVHIEVQSQKDYDFPQRMYIYNYRAFDLYRKPVISVAILGDEYQSWRPNNYGYNVGNCEVNLKFPTVKLLDYEDKWTELETNLNPFAMMIMAHLKTKATISNLTEREQWKWFFIRSLYEKGYSKKQIVKLFKFIDLMMTLPKQLQQSLVQKINDYEEEKTMPLLSTMEQMAMERGELKGELKLITRQLNRKFGQLNSDLKSQIQALNIDNLEQLGEDLFDLDSLDDLQKWLLNFKA
jgi:hypothetical protein